MTMTILPRSAADVLGPIHDRTPVIVPEGLRDDWLDPDLVDKAVGNVRNNGPELIEPAPALEARGAGDAGVGAAAGA